MDNYKNFPACASHGRVLSISSTIGRFGGNNNVLKCPKGCQVACLTKLPIYECGTHFKQPVELQRIDLKRNSVSYRCPVTKGEDEWCGSIGINKEGLLPLKHFVVASSLGTNIDPMRDSFFNASFDSSTPVNDRHTKQAIDREKLDLIKSHRLTERLMEEFDSSFSTEASKNLENTSSNDKMDGDAASAKDTVSMRSDCSVATVSMVAESGNSSSILSLNDEESVIKPSKMNTAAGNPVTYNRNVDRSRSALSRPSRSGYGDQSAMDSFSFHHARKVRQIIDSDSSDDDDSRENADSPNINQKSSSSSSPSPSRVFNQDNLHHLASNSSKDDDSVIIIEDDPNIVEIGTQKEQSDDSNDISYQQSSSEKSGSAEDNSPTAAVPQEVDPNEYALLNAKLAKLRLALPVAASLPDKGEKIRQAISSIRERLTELDAQKLNQEMPVSVVPKYPNPRHMVKDPWKEKDDIQQWQNKFGPQTDGNRLYGGKMTAARQYEAKAVTHEAVVELHNAITKCPRETDETPDPVGLTVSLMEHQRQALTWLLWRENQKPAGGILADDMGLGKTLTMIALILHQKRCSEKDSESRNPWQLKVIKQQNLISSTSTLIICPASVMHQWNKEIERRVAKHTFTVLIYHGAKRSISATQLAQFDIVLTTYGTVKSEVVDKAPVVGDDGDSSQKSKRKEKQRGNSPLLGIAWERIILDEAHVIKNHTTSQAQACCLLPANKRWGLSGTPLQNQLMDLYSLLKFIRCAPFDELAVWKNWIESKSEQANQRLNTLVRSLLLRRTKDQTSLTTGKALVSLPPKRYEMYKLDLSQTERKIYDKLFLSSQQFVNEYLKSQEQKDAELAAVTSGRVSHSEYGYRNPFKSSHARSGDSNPGRSGVEIFVLLLRLRQACVHLALTKEGVDMDALRESGAEQELVEKLTDLSMYEPNDIIATSVEEAFESSFRSTKISALLDRFDEVFNSDKSSRPKFVIVSQWVLLLNIVAEHLKSRNVTYTIISGKIDAAERSNRTEQFNDLRGGPQVMLLSLTAGGVGLNLVGGNHLFIVDLHWNPAQEQQACDRIYRVGQTRNVFIHKFICQNTIEERVLALQENKLKLAKSVLSGAGARNMNRLTLHDLKFLFGLSANLPNAKGPIPMPVRR